MAVFRALHEKEIEKWMDFANEIFVYEPREYFINQWYHDPYRDVDGIFVAVDEDGSFVSSVRVFLREIYIDGVSVRTGGIGNVGTKKTHRNQGFSTSLFEMCAAYMRSKGVEASYLLCGSQNEAYYNRYGYCKIPFIRKISALKDDGTVRGAFTVRDADFSKDIGALSPMYERFAKSFNGPTVRKPIYWEEWVPSFLKGKYKVAEDEDGEAIAYVNYHFKDKRIYVYDFGHGMGHEGIFDALIYKIGAMLGMDDLEVEYPSAVNSKMDVTGHDEVCSVMFRCMQPFSIGNVRIGNTDELLHALHGGGSASKLLLWDADNI